LQVASVRGDGVVAGTGRKDESHQGLKAPKIRGQLGPAGSSF
jgi:hypothetical protein